MDIENISSAIDSVSSYRASLGAEQNALDRMVDFNDVFSENLAAAESSLTDEDMAAASVDLSLTALQLKSNIMVARIANETQKSILQLIGGFIDLKI